MEDVKLGMLEEVLKDINPKSVSEGEVLDVRADDAVIRFYSVPADGHSWVRIFPKERLEHISAAFPTAKVRYEIYSIGPCNISVMKYIGPTREELLNEPFDELSENDIKELERD